MTHPSTPSSAPTRPDPPNPSNPPAGDRIAHLFRYSIRCGHVHPLQDLLRRYRAGERA